ncbi:arsenate reductase [Rhodobacter sp. TJ_12]|uniref:arsenate reductase family protein n=1 Tax=Rhodobacter sp. TJ_12 TaxID=2029399 RepID=UPI001CBE5338|nr:ArsC/Spx/MgsR family protein [Rhodobacter sp. TJ_12]MBZ4022214.1 arsenate reductase [Rhodobacter sp. TJ_12]
MIVYGIKTCGTVQKALAALHEAGKDPVLRDVRKEPLSAEEIAEFEAAFGDKLVNRASMTWRKLSEEERALPVADLIAAHPTLMKRPVIRGNGLTLGWTKDAQATQLRSA